MPTGKHSRVTNVFLALCGYASAGLGRQTKGGMGWDGGHSKTRDLGDYIVEK